MWPFKRKPSPTNAVLMDALRLCANLDRRLNEMEAREAEHAAAIDKLGRQQGLEWDAEKHEWVFVGYELEEHAVV